MLYYRDIRLIDVTAKVFDIILLKKIIIKYDQAPARYGRGALRWSYQHTIFMRFADFASVVDSVDWFYLGRIKVGDGIYVNPLGLIKVSTEHYTREA